ncbi:MAG TPA: hypothetical protein VKZ54_01495 [Membranihabitans sp.]|nr:hypothetical protein [Membranihabitans sp.]
MTDRKKHINRLIGLGASLVVILGVIGLFTSFGFLNRQFLSGVNFTVVEISQDHSLLDSLDMQYSFRKLYPDSLQGLPLDSISLEAIEAEYNDNPFVKECRAYIDKHYVLQIELEERIPLFRIYSNNGGDYYIDRDGISMPVSDHYTPRVTLATGAIPLLPLDNSVDSSRIHQDLYRAVKAIEADEFMAGYVSEIHVNEAGQIVFYPLVGDFTIRLNNTDQIENKFENLKIFLRDGLSRIGWDKYSELVIGYENQIIGKKIVNP